MAALAYYEIYPDEIEERLERESEWTGFDDESQRPNFAFAASLRNRVSVPRPRKAPDAVVEPLSSSSTAGRGGSLA